MNSRIALNVFASIPISCFIAGCHSNRAESLTSRSLREIKSPAASGTFSPKVTSRSDGGVILSWLEPQGDTLAALGFSVWQNEAWSEPTTIAAAQPFSRHPSESPGVVALIWKDLYVMFFQDIHDDSAPDRMLVFSAAVGKTAASRPNGNVVCVLRSSLDLGRLGDGTNAIYPIFKTF